MNTYRPFARMYVQNDIGAYISYGIIGKGESGEIVAIDDVSADAARAEAICEALTDGDVSLEHMQEVIEDMLC